MNLKDGLPKLPAEFAQGFDNFTQVVDVLPNTVDSLVMTVKSAVDGIFNGVGTFLKTGRSTLKNVLRPPT